MYKTFTEWKNGKWLEDGEPRKEAYTKDELLLVEMGWKYGFDAGKAQQADRIAGLEKQVVIWEKATMDARIKSAIEKQSKPVAWIRSGDDQLSLVKEKDDGYMVWKPLYLAPQTKPLSDEEVTDVFVTCLLPDGEFDEHEFARAIEERHGIK